MSVFGTEIVVLVVYEARKKASVWPPLRVSAGNSGVRLEANEDERDILIVLTISTNDISIEARKKAENKELDIDSLNNTTLAIGHFASDFWRILLERQSRYSLNSRVSHSRWCETQACIKGHRSSSCAHTDRPLFEIKKKGRPPTQCSHCRDLRKKKQVHVKCMCEARGPLILDPSQIAEGSSTSIVSSAKGKGQAKKKKKDVTLTAPALPNGLKDVQNLSSVGGLKKEEDESTIPNSLGKGKARMKAIAKQCLCRVGGECHCFTEKHVARNDSSSINPSGSTLNSSSGSGSGCCSSVFSPPTSHEPNLPSTPSTSSSPALSTYSNLPLTPMTLPAPFADYFPSPLATHEPIASSSSNHTPSSSSSRYSSSGQLANRPLPNYLSRASYYTPYPQSSSHSVNRLQVRNSAESISSASRVASPEEILRRGLKELVGNYVRARKETSSVSLLLGKENNESSCHRMAGGDRTSGSDINPEVEGLPSLSAIYEDAIGDVLMVSTCTCGKDCKCPSCKEHGNHPEDVDNESHVDCPETCSSCFNCSSSVALPANLTTVADLFSASVAMLPPSNPSNSQFMLRSVDTISTPNNTQFSEDAFASEKKPLTECCDGQCQCPPGECSCMKDCCGCCEKCLCEGTASGLEASFKPESNSLAHQTTATLSSPIKPDEINDHSSSRSAMTDQTSIMPFASSTMRPSFTSSLAGHSVPTSTGQSSRCSETQCATTPSSILPSSQVKLETEDSGGCCSKKNLKTIDAYENQPLSLSEEVTNSSGRALSSSTPSSSISNPLHTNHSSLDHSHRLSMYHPAMFPGMHQPTGFKGESETSSKSDFMSSATGNELIDQSGSVQKDESGLDVLCGFEFNLDLELAIAATLGNTGHNFNLVQPSTQQQHEPTPSMVFAASTGNISIDPPSYSTDFNAILASIASQSDTTNLNHSTFTPTSPTEQTTSNAPDKLAHLRPSTNIYADNRCSPSESHSRSIYSLSKDSPIHPSSRSSSSIASSNQSLPASAPPEVSPTPDTLPNSFDLDQYLRQVLNVTHLDNTFPTSNTPPPFATPSSFTSRHGIDQQHSNKPVFPNVDEKVYHRGNSANMTELTHGQGYSMSDLGPVEGYHNQSHTHPQHSQHQHRHQHPQPQEGSIHFNDGLGYTTTNEGQVDWVSLGL
ncbi:Copper fist DNA-binding [Phaffia rhodozyma]|uniref:Copper fist DNA-binding n=1 Tax=Phaffia rhodozyma TaxID=264483 RepID=A0A0F7SRB4_PHARH|nr:Copper fist DNA-binding [Phaffia rhodozyma]